MTEFNIWSRSLALYFTLNTVIITPVLAQEQPQRRILTVTGQGFVTIPTTVTQVSLGVEVQGKTASEVQQELARRSSAVIALLRSRNVRKLETTSLRIEPTYNTERGTRRLTGFAGSNVVSFRIDTQLSGQLLDEAVQAGATRLNGISFIASEDSIATAKQQAIRLATQDAQLQADAALGSLNLTRREVVNIEINQPGAFNRSFEFNNANSNVGDIALSQTPVVAGDRQVQAFVTLRIDY